MSKPIAAQTDMFYELIAHIEILEREELWEDVIYETSIFLTNFDTISNQRKKILNIKRLKGLTQRGLFDEALIASKSLQEDTDLSIEEEKVVLYEVSKIYENTSQEYKSHQALDAIAAYSDSIYIYKYPLYLKRKASVFQTYKKEKLSRVYALKLLSFGEKNNDSLQMAEAYYILGSLNINPFETKLDYLSKALYFFKEKNFKFKKALAAINQGVNYTSVNQSGTALSFFNLAETNLNKKYHLKELELVYRNKSQVFENLNILDSALIYERKSKNHLIQFEEEKARINLRQVDYRFKEKEIIFEEKQYVTNIEELKKDRLSLLIVSLIAVFFITFITFLLIKNRKNTTKIKLQNNKISKQNKSLEVVLDEKKLLLKELNHRVKNNLSLIISLIKFQSDEIVNPSDKRKLLDLEYRIHTIALAHEQFVYSEDLKKNDSFEIDTYINKILDSLKTLSIRNIVFDILIDKAKMSIDTALPIGILANELVTNSIEHAVCKSDPLVVSFNLYQIDRYIHINYKDNGATFQYNETNKSLGLFIIDSMVHQLKGTIKRENSTYTIKLKIK